MFRSVSQVVLDVSMAMRWVSPASRAIAAQETVAKVLSAALAATSDGAPSSLHRRLSAGYCRILPDIAGYCWIVFLVFVFYLVLPAISSTIQPKTIQMTTSQSLVDRSRVDSSSEVHWPSSGSQLQGHWPSSESQLQGEETDAAIHSDSDRGPA